jgi:hypothetical protein
MASISDVAGAIGRALADAAFRPVPPRKAPGSGARSGSGRQKVASGGGKSAKKPAKAKGASRARPAKAARSPAKKRQKTSKSARSRRLTK